MITLLDLYQEAEAAGIDILNFRMSHREAMSVMDHEGNCYIGLDYRKIGSEQYEKYLLSHELGHCKKGAFYTQSSPFDLREKHEYRADKWMVNRLIPREELEAAIEQGATELWELADLFEVPESVIFKAGYIYGYFD